MSRVFRLGGGRFVVSTENALMQALNYQGLAFPGWCTAEGHAKKKGKILKDKEALESAERLGKTLATFCKVLKQGQIAGDKI